jgi:hypothetical protein
VWFRRRHALLLLLLQASKALLFKKNCFHEGKEGEDLGKAKGEKERAWMP